MTEVQLLLFAKAPAAGRVKTRMCPPCTPAQAAAVAAAALADTITAVAGAPATRRTLVVCGSISPPAGWAVAHQRGGGLGERLANAFADTCVPGAASLLLGMDTPQVKPQLLADVAGQLERADAVLGPAVDGGWWVLALRDPDHADVLAEVAMSTSDTGARTAAALRERGLAVALAPLLRDVDTAADAWAVAQGCPDGRFARAVRSNVPVPARMAARPIRVHSGSGRGAR